MSIDWRGYPQVVLVDGPRYSKDGAPHREGLHQDIRYQGEYILQHLPQAGKAPPVGRLNTKWDKEQL